MANTKAVVRRLEKKPDVRYWALWLNTRGLEQAIRAGLVYIHWQLSVSASDAFGRRNVNRGTEESLAAMSKWTDHYESVGIAVDGLSIMAAFGCNFEGDIAERRVTELVERVDVFLRGRKRQLRRLSLADTMGWANPFQVKRLIGSIRECWPMIDIRLHLHDTRGAHPEGS